MKEMEKLETAVGKSIEQWNVSDLDIISENLDLLNLLRKSEVAAECVQRSKNNKELLDIFVPLSIKSLVVEAEQDSNELLKQFSMKEIDADKLLFECNARLTDEKQTVYKRLVAYLTIISIFPDQNLLDQEIKIKEDVAEIKEIICGLAEQDLYSTYSLIEDLLELIIPLRQRFYSKNKIDLLDDEDQRLENVLDNLKELKIAMAESAASLVNPNESKGGANE